MRTSRWVLATYALLILLSIAAALPSLLPASGRAHLPSWLESRQVTLGLDLRGGSHLVLEVDQDALKVTRLQSVRDDAEAALEAAGIAARSAIEGDRLIISPAESRAAAVVRPHIPQVGASAFAPGASEFAVTEEAGALSLATTEDVHAQDRTAYSATAPHARTGR